MREYTEAPGIATASIPEEMQSYPSWIVWRYEKRDGKVTKVPYSAITSWRASTTESRTWATFPDALEAYETGRFDGLGFVFSSGDPYCGVDLDECRDPQTGEIESWAEKIIAAAGQDAYVEASPSGRGVHIIVRGKAHPDKNRRGRVEAYSQWRFFTVTGRALR